jgi:phosphatidylserine/phosphatidylglycerophosphate/cardiolipin synthase-like enzyme
MSSDSANNRALANDAFTFLNKVEYLEDLVKRINKTHQGDRVLVASMLLEPREEPIGRLLDALCAAADRGVMVGLMIDARCGPRFGNAPFSRRSRADFRAVHEALARLQSHGGRYAIVNESVGRLVNPFAGRSHIKVAIVNDEVYAGSANLAGMKHTELLVRWRDAKASDWLYQLMNDVIEKQSTELVFRGQDQELVLDDRTRLLLDAGKPKQSIIFENALRLIDEAKEWLVMTCQYFPAGVTIDHLLRAHQRGVKVQLYYNTPIKLTSGFYYDHPAGPGLRTLVHIMLLRRARGRLPAVFFEHELSKGASYLHAKLLASEQGAMIGSHNYIAAGVNFGTAELCLQRMDGDFSRRAVASLTKDMAHDVRL